MNERHSPRQPRLDEIRSFWDSQPLGTRQTAAEAGTPEFFAQFDRVKEEHEIALAYPLYRFPEYRGKKVLDVGCGNGWVLAQYARYRAVVSGIDLSSAAVQTSRRRFELSQLAGEFLVANAEELPFSAETFDLVVSTGVLHHTPRTEVAVGEILRVLRRDGRALVMLYHKASLYYQVWLRLESLVRGVPMAEVVNRYDGLGNPLGKAYTKQEAASLFEGFRDLSFHVNYLSLPLWDFLLLPPVRALLRPHFGWNLWINARK